MSRLDCATLPSIAFVGDPLCISVLMWFIKWMQSNCRNAFPWSGCRPGRDSAHGMNNKNDAAHKLDQRSNHGCQSCPEKMVSWNKDCAS
jgi:hypothetical protein